MAFNFDSSFGLDQAGLELSLNDFSFDSSQAGQPHTQHPQQRELHNMLLQDDHNHSGGHTQAMDHSQTPPGTFDFHPSALTPDMLASASTTPVFQTNPDKGNLPSQSLQQQLHNQQHQQLLQQQNQQQQQQQQQHQQQHFQNQQQQQQHVIPTSQQDQLLTPAGSDYYSTDYTQFMSPLGVQPDTSDAAMTITDQFEDDEVFFTPLISPAMTPSHPYSSLPHALSTANEIFSPLTSPALQPHRSSTIDYLSFSGQNFSPLPMQFHQAQAQQQHIQHQFHQLHAQPQPDLAPQTPQQQQLQHQQHQQQLAIDVQQQQIQGSQTSLMKPSTRIDAQSPALNARRPSIKRKTTVERVTNGLTTTVPRSTGPVRVALPKSSPALRPLTNPLSPATLRKQQSSRGRSSSIAPASPLIMHFPSGRPSPSPLLIATTQPPTSVSQASPSPRLVTNMHQLSMMPSSPMAFANASGGPKSPALFALPASSMMPPPRSPMTLPSASQNQTVHTPRQLSLVPAPQQLQVHNQNQPSTHQPSSPNRPSPALRPADNEPSPPLSLSSTDKTEPTTNAPASSSSTVASAAVLTPKSALAPVTPASLMNLGSGSGSESTPTSSPKFGVHAKSKPSAHGTNGNAGSSASTPMNPPPASSSSTSSTQKRGTKRQANGDATASGTLGPSTPRQLALTPGTASMSPMPPPPSGFALISPALKPTLMPQHRNSQPMLVSPRLQPHLVSPSLKPWLPGVSQNEVMARLASKSNYQNILDGDHTALGLSYNTDLHSGIELRRTSHKAAEQKRRDSLKNCFDDLRQMIPNIQEKAPSKVFLLKKSFDYICNLKSDVAKRDLELARLRAEHDFMKNAMQAWFTSLPEDSPFKTAGGSGDKSLIESWTMPEEDIQKATVKESEALARAVEITEISAAAVEAARTQPGGQNKGSRESQGDGEDSEEEGTVAPKGKKGGLKSGTASSSKGGGTGKKLNKNGPAANVAEGSGRAGGSGTDGDIVMRPSSEPDSFNAQNVSASHQLNAKSNKSQEDDDEEEDNEDEDGEAEDQEMADGTLT
ncbi:hypothetical protein EC968_003572 [Mortierella alpina]|nr:hypothetical protein EC968_003572 [Mortierella alpina]